MQSSQESKEKNFDIISKCPKCSLETPIEINFCPSCGFSIVRQRIYLLNQKKEENWKSVKSIIIFYCIIFSTFLIQVKFPKIENTFLGNEIIAWIDLTIILIYFWYEKPEKFFFNKNIPLLKISSVLVLLLICTIATNFFYHNSLYFYFGVEVEYEEKLDIALNYSTLSIIFFNCILPAFSEELAFRSIIFEKFKTVLPLKESMLLTGLLFGIIHLDFYSAPYLCMIGVLLCWIKEYSNSIIFCMAFHFLHNLIVEFY